MQETIQMSQIVQEQIPKASEILDLAEQLFSFGDNANYLDMFYTKLNLYVQDAERNRMGKLSVTTVQYE